MTELPDLEARGSTLEAQVGDLTQRVRRSEHDAAAARVLAGGADRDVTEMRTEIRQFREQNTRVLNAVREDLNDLRSHVDTGFAEMRAKFDVAAAGQEQIAGLLTAIFARDGGQDDLQ